ncbi:MAG: UDP-N-acetylmuramate--L-alanine ligase [Candidatus Riflebacteria bacterium]|nr:UDP-N-acetylmuramate--L-alanine ligase [Candidatus Riflebacteria bacterium]
MSRATALCLAPEESVRTGPEAVQAPTVLSLEGVKRLHFIGIGGVGMSGIAQLCMLRGFSVSGSDLKASLATERLAKMGALIFVGHAASNITDCELVVVSSAIASENPELAEARSRGLRIHRRAELLAWLMHRRHGIAIAGAHGKTTTTSLTSHVLQQTGLDPTLIVGGEVNGLGSNVRHGNSPLVVVEADESDGSFLCLPCRTVVVTNIDDDHMDHYRTMENMEAAYLQFINAVGPQGLAILCADDQRIRRLLPHIRVPKLVYGFSPDVDIRAVNVAHHGRHSTYQVAYRGQLLGPYTLNIPGRHNVLNSIAAIAVARQLGVSPEAIGRVLPTFDGVKRRFQFIGEANGIKIFDDYAHHPTEIRATLASARLSKPRRVVAIFQPHRYSRTEMLASSFAGAFGDADLVLLLPIYSAGEKQREGVSSERIYQRMVEEHPYVIALAPGNPKESYVPLISSQLECGDWVFTVGAGDVTQMGGMILNHLGCAGG